MKLGEKHIYWGMGRDNHSKKTASKRPEQNKKSQEFVAAENISELY